MYFNGQMLGKKLRETEKGDGYHYCLKPSVYANNLSEVCSVSAWSQSQFFQSAFVVCVRDQCQHTHAFQTGFYRLRKVPLSCCWLFFFPVAAFQLIATVRKKKATYKSNISHTKMLEGQIPAKWQ